MTVTSFPFHPLTASNSAPAAMGLLGSWVPGLAVVAPSGPPLETKVQFFSSTSGQNDEILIVP